MAKQKQSGVSWTRVVVRLSVSLAAALALLGPNGRAQDGGGTGSLRAFMLGSRSSGTTMERGGNPRAGCDDTELFGIQLRDGGSGVRRQGDMVALADRLPVPADTGVIWLEAEAFEDICAAEDVVRTDPEASGNAYVDNPDFLSNPFRVSAAGSYGIWLRAREGMDDKNSFLWTVDSGRRWFHSEKVSPDDGDAPKQGVWRWVKLLTLPLTAGDHRVLIQRYYKGTWHYDRFAVVADGEGDPEGTGPASDACMRCLDGTVETREVRAPASRRLVRITPVLADALPPGSAVRFEWSTDGGQSWQRVDDGDLRGVPVAGDGTDRVRFRVLLSRPSAGPGPRLRGVRLELVPQPGAWLVLRNDFLRVILDAATGRLFRLTDVRHERELLWPDEPASLFSVDLKRPGEETWFRYTDADVSVVSLNEKGDKETTTGVDKAEGLGGVIAEAVRAGAPGAAVLTGARCEGREAAVEYTVDKSVCLVFRVSLDDTAQSLWHAEVSNEHESLDVIRLEFPRLERIRLGPTGTDDLHWRMQSFGHYRRMPGMGPVRDEKYPGGVTLPWQSVHDQVGGIGMTVRDALGTNVGFESRDDWFFQHTFRTSIRKYHNVPAKGGRATWQYAVCVHPGSWHWVADRYREWALERFVRPRYPAWFADNHGFYNCGIQNTGMPFRELGKLAEGAKAIGLSHLQVWGQFTGRGGGCCGPYWQPSPLYGSVQDFRQGIADVHAAGCRIGVYFLADRIDRYHALGSHIYGMIPKTMYPSETEFPRHEFFTAVQWVGNPKGEPDAYPLSAAQWTEYGERIAAYEADPEANPPPRSWWPVDLSDPVWWEYMRHWAIDLDVESHGIDGHYYDVLGTGRTRESYDRRKGHHGHGVCGIGKVGIAWTTVECARERGYEDYFLLMEGMSDMPGQWTAAMISGLYHNHSEMMRYTWPDFIMFEGHSNSGHLRPLRSLEAAYLNGNRFDIVFSNEVMGKVVALRAATHRWIYRARFMDTLGLSSPAPARWLLRDEPDAAGIAVNIANFERTHGRVRLAHPRVGSLTRALCVEIGGRVSSVPLEHVDDAVSFAVPQADLATVILAERASGREALLTTGRLTRRGAETRLDVQVGNLGVKPLNGVVAADRTDPFRLPERRAVLACNPGTVSTVSLAAEAAGEHWRWAQMSFDVEVGGRVLGTVEFMAWPLIFDASLEHVGNDTQDCVHGQKSLRLDPSMEGFNARHYPLALEPRHRYRVSLAYKRTPGQSQISSALIWQRLEESSEVKRGPLPFRKENVWDRTETEFETAERFVSTDLYVYNVKSERTLWVDDVRVEDLGPVAE